MNELANGAAEESLADLSIWLGLWERLLEWLQLHALSVILILLLAWLLGRISRIVIMRLTLAVKRTLRGDELAIAEQEKRAQTIGGLLAVGVRVLIYTVAVLMILAELDVNITALLAGAGIVGVALGFGAQSIVKDMLSGLFILIEDQYRIGDIIQINGGEFGGLVEKMSIRTTWLRSLDGNVHIIPNGSINAVSNFTHTWTRIVLDFGISYEDDMDTAIAVIRDTALGMSQDEGWSAAFLEPPQVLGVEELGDSAVTIRMLAKTVPAEQWKVARELRRRVKYALEAAGMTIPFPQVTVSYLKEAEEGAETRQQIGPEQAFKPASDISGLSIDSDKTGLEDAEDVKEGGL